jgi:hypothetical protein
MNKKSFQFASAHINSGILLMQLADHCWFVEL